MEKSYGLICDNPKCTEDFHMNEIDNNVLDVVMSIVESSYHCIPIFGKDERIQSSKRNMMPYYNEVKLFKTDTIYCHDQWVKEGR